MKPVINLEDPAGRTVGRRLRPKDALEYGFGMQKSLNDLFGCLPIAKGVYRFHSHEEADAWMMDRLTRRKGT